MSLLIDEAGYHVSFVWSIVEEWFGVVQKKVSTLSGLHFAEGESDADVPAVT